jgi:ribonuclease M5
MKTVREIIVVEGRYDAAAVKRAVHATVVETAGFGIFSDADKVQLIRRLAAERGVVILTDSDSAGQFIRSRLKGLLPDQALKHAYIPVISGKERRKSAPSKEGILGVEAMPPETILLALEKCGATFDGISRPLYKGDLTKADLYAMGLSGGTASAQHRRALARKLDLPEGLTANGLLEVLNVLYTRQESMALIE